jgi:hypothetical protein
LLYNTANFFTSPCREISKWLNPEAERPIETLEIKYKFKEEYAFYRELWDEDFNTCFWKNYTK